MFGKLLCFILSLSIVVGLQAQASPNIEHWSTENGARVYFVAAPELPMLDLSVVFDAGSARDEIAGTALLTNAMLNEGAKGLSADQLAEGFENVGARFSNSSERDMALLSVRSLTESEALTQALLLFTNVLTQADFPQASFERIKKQILIGLQGEKQSPSAIAARALYKNIYGKHPYAAMPIGDKASVEKITLDSLRTFYQRYYVANNATIILVGAIDKSRAKTIAEQVSSGLAKGEKAGSLVPIAMKSHPATTVIEHPSTQTHILMGQIGISRYDDDYFPLYVGNHILGGSGLVSRLTDEIREKRGLSYSSYSYFRPMRHQGPYIFGLQTRNDQTGEALKVLKQTIDDFTNVGPTEEELQAAKQNIIGGFALRVDSNRKITNYLTMIGFYQLPLDYLDTFKDKVSAVTVEQIKEAYHRRISTDNMATILVGPV